MLHAPALAIHAEAHPKPNARGGSRWRRRRRRRTGRTRCGANWRGLFMVSTFGNYFRESNLSAGPSPVDRSDAARVARAMQTWWRLGGVGGVLVLGGLGTAIAGPPPDAAGPAAVPCPAPSMPAPPVVIFPPPGARVPANVEVRVELGAEHSTVAATARTRPVALEERVTPAKRHLAVRPRSPLAGGTVLALAHVRRSAPAGRPPATRALAELARAAAADRAPPRLVAVGTPTWRSCRRRRLACRIRAPASPGSARRDGGGRVARRAVSCARTTRGPRTTRTASWCCSRRPGPN